ncbi:MAG: ROK family protein [Verrucomicrobia bacterium]|nr:ROK family protein [Verrucomicrobiota bacterium]
MTDDIPFLVEPRVFPILEAAFRPAALWNKAFANAARASKNPIQITLGLEQADGSMFHHSTLVLPGNHPNAATNFTHVERLVKFLLWSRGGFRIYISGPKELADQLRRHYRESPTGKFDADIMGSRVYEHPLEIVHTHDIPPARSTSKPLGRHLKGCRIGFDLGGSDRKVTAVIDGKCVFSEETVWNPVPQADPQWHFEQIMDSLKTAAAHMPRVDAIGGSSAGVIVNNRIKVASLFRGVPPSVFNARVKDLFLELKRAWGGIPFEVANDGEVTALAGSIALGTNGVLGIAMGSSMAGGYVNRDGNITTWLNELAFAPIDYNPRAPVDEWSGDYGCGVQYFSQQCVGRLLAADGIEIETALPLPEKLKQVQALMIDGDERAERIYRTIGTYLGYAILHYTEFYDFDHVLVLGRVMSGPGGDVIVAGAKEVVKAEMPELGERITFHLPDEKEKRHGQAIAAASLPCLA